jgi:hypothetical protein
VMFKKSETPMFVASTGLIVITIALEILLPASTLWWIVARIVLPVVVLAVISWAFTVYLRASCLAGGPRRGRTWS